jgi:transcriptional regulator with XRE-family HTH domain
MSRDAFGPNLRRIRVQRHITLEEIARNTKVDKFLLEGLETNDFSRWPSGVYARSYVRQYAQAIGADPDSTVDEFCRWFAEGDRRLGRTLREHAEIIGHDDPMLEDLPPRDQPDRRGGDERAAAGTRPAETPTSLLATWFVRLRRVLGGA